MLTSLLHEFKPGLVRCFAGGGYPCCCAGVGSSSSSSSSVAPSEVGGSSPAILPGCNSCLDGLIAQYYQVELSGLIDGAPGCDECHSLNGVYIVEIEHTEPTACYGSIPIDGACVDDFGSPCYRELRLRFAAPTPSLGVLAWVTIGRRPDEVGVGECANVTSITWSKYLTLPNQPAACLELVNEPIPYGHRTGVVAYCQAESSLAYITALA